MATTTPVARAAPPPSRAGDPGTADRAPATERAFGHQGEAGPTDGAAPVEGLDAGDRGLTPEERSRGCEAEMDAPVEQLLQAPVELVISNHAMGLWELAALHLSESPPQLRQAQLAIDALTALVEGLQGRLGEAERTLAEGLAEIRMAFVQIATAERSPSEPGRRHLAAHPKRLRPVGPSVGHRHHGCARTAATAARSGRGQGRPGPSRRGRSARGPRGCTREGPPKRARRRSSRLARVPRATVGGTRPSCAASSSPAPESRTASSSRAR